MELTGNILNVFKLNWLFGPIADKELRVSSRRKRYYFLRAIYVALLLFFVCKAWAFRIFYYSGMDPSAYMSEIAKQICRNIVTLQFFSAHVIALFLLSGILSEEINKRTLPVLLTTPITSFQIVAGKIFSKLTQVFLLLCLSFPVLAIVRVFGGVPWNLIVYSTCITILGVLFSASIIVFLSTIFTKTHNVFIASIIVIPLYYGFTFFALINNIPFISNSQVMTVSTIINPFIMFYWCFHAFDDPSILTSGQTGQSSFLVTFIFHAIFILLVSFILMLLSAWRVRRVALMQMSSSRMRRKRWFMIVCEFIIGLLPRISRNREIRDVKGRAVVWKEMHNSLFRSEVLRGREIYLILVAAIIIVYVMLFSLLVSGGDALIGIAAASWFFGAYLVTVITPATSIVKEKETSSWQILLCTPMSDGEILWGKIAGVLRKSSIMWIGVLIFAALISYVGEVGYTPLVLSFSIVCSIVALFTGIGVYFSVICRSSTTSIIFTALLGVVMMILSGCMLFLFESHGGIFGVFGYFDFMEIVVYTSPAGPFMMLEGIIDLEYVTFVVVYAIVNVGIGAIFAMRAKKKMRKKIF
jgi:ABC-type transport system involved in multi-copper enzyme maturation permease subunit